MPLASRMFRFAIPVLLLLGATASHADSLPAGWSERHGTYVLPAQNGAQFALVGFVNPANHQITYGFRELPQRMNCAPAAHARGVTYDVEGTRISFDRECFRGSLTFIPRNVPAKRAFAALLGNRKILHVRTPSFFPLTFDLSGFPAVQRQLEAVAAAGSRHD